MKTKNVKHLKNKLSLNRETLVALQPDDLGGVHGGQASVISALLSRYPTCQILC